MDIQKRELSADTTVDRQMFGQGGQREDISGFQYLFCFFFFQSAQSNFGKCIAGNKGVITSQAQWDASPFRAKACTLGGQKVVSLEASKKKPQAQKACYEKLLKCLSFLEMH